MFLEMGSWKLEQVSLKEPSQKGPPQLFLSCSLGSSLSLFGRVVINYSMNINNLMYFILLLHAFFIP
jgi:hypothetical protein